MTWGKFYWPLYLIATSCLFLGPEVYALFTNYRDTLSQYAWSELNLTTHMNIHTIAWYLSLIAWGLFVVIISLHIWGRWNLV